MPNHHILYAGIYIIMMTCKLGTKRKQAIQNNINYTQKVTLSYKDKRLTANGYYDTGNLLYDQFNNNPVIILDFKTLKNWMTQDAYKILIEYSKTGEFDYPAFAKQSDIKMYPLPYKTIGTSFQLMPAFCLSSLLFNDSGRKYKHVTAGISQLSFMNMASHQILLNERLKPIREENSND